MKYHKLVENAGNPQGFWGRLMIKSMNKGHLGVTGWGLEHINIERSDTVLDVGCGGGKTVARIAEKIGNGKVYGVDCSDLCVKNSQKLNEKSILCNKVKIYKASVSDLPFEDETFDVVTAVETYYFWQDKLCDLKEIFRVMKTGGTILLVFEMLKTADNPDKWKPVEDRLGIKAVSENEIAEILAQAGFSDVKTYTKQDTTWLCATGTKKQGEAI